MSRAPARALSAGRRMRPRVVISLAAAAALASGCANGGGAAGVESIAQILAAPKPSACGPKLDAPALGVAAPRLVTGRGKDLAAFTAQIDAALAAAGDFEAVRVVPREAAAVEAGEVAGSSTCNAIVWAWMAGASDAVVLVTPTAEVAAAIERGQRALEAGRAPEARVAWAEAAKLTTAAAPTPATTLAGTARTPATTATFAAPALAIAQSYLVEDRAEEAVAAYSALVDRFPGNPLAHAGLGDALRQAERRGEAAEAWSRAVALWPTQGQLVRRVASDPFIEARPLVVPPARRLRDGRWVLAVKAGPRSPELNAALLAEAQIYVDCKERWRRQPAVRASLLADEAAASAWSWSPAEESACSALWLRAYQRHREQGRLEDAALDDLLGIARAGFLDARALFDVGALSHPLITALLTAEEREHLFAFVAAHRMIRRRQGGWLF